MASNKNRIQYLLNEYLERHGSIDLLLPDGVGVEIGITQEDAAGSRKYGDYCCVVTKREDDERSAIFDRYAMSLEFGDGNCHVLDDTDRGVVTVI